MVTGYRQGSSYSVADRRMMGRVEEGGFEGGGVSKEIKIGFRVLINY